MQPEEEPKADEPVSEPAAKQVTVKVNKKLLWWGGVIVVLLGAGLLTWRMRWYQPVYALYNNGSIAIKVKEGDKFALEGATVTVNGVSYTTDATGKVSITRIVAGTYKAQVSKDGYTPVEQNLAVKRGDNDLVFISLNKVPEKLFSVHGFVQDYVGGAPVLDVQVTLSGKTKATNPNGEFSFDKMAPGDYKLTFSKAGYSGKELAVTVADADVATDKVELVPSGQVIFVSNRDGKRALYIANYDGSEQKQFIAPQNGGEDFGPQLSPDNKWVVFSSTRDHSKNTYNTEVSKLYIAGRDGQHVTKVNDDVSHSVLQWSPNSRFVYYQAYNSNQETQMVQRFYDVSKGSVFDLGDTSASQVSFSHDGSKVVYLVAQYGQGGQPTYTNTLQMLNLVNGERKTLVTNVSDNFTVVGFSFDDLQVTYESTVASARRRYDIVLATGEAKEVALVSPDNRTYYLSPDGLHKAFVEKRDGKDDLFIVDSKTGKTETRLTKLGVVNENIPVVWSENSAYLTFGVKREGENALYIVAASGGESRKVTDFYDDQQAPRYY